VSEVKAWKKQHRITRFTIHLVMERSLQQLYGVQNKGNVLWDQLKEDDRLKVKLNVWALCNEISAVQ
jgi:hypothetical protein